ncbi:glycerophosphoinositol permease [Saguinus oedipus]|uniref:Glycerophosphoinositol permease n=1 Tax=Saguinus oedipus TaxID=9490 RepID=A0ABQ9T9H0_SAGOE|nr:glycerophosphoinositol permease [Saguinus oedipus]
MVRISLRSLTSCAYRLQSECKKTLPPRFAHRHPAGVTEQVIQCAYNITRAAKQLVTITTKENNNLFIF